MSLQVDLTPAACAMRDKLAAAAFAAESGSWLVASRLYHEAARMLSEDGELNLAWYYEARAHDCARHIQKVA